MRIQVATFFLFAVVFGGGYWYYIASAVCNVPIAYSIGNIDPRFNISFDEVRGAVSSAESMWEDATGRNLFTYDEAATLKIEFIFDDRQKEAIEEEILRIELEEKGGVSKEVRDTYENLLDSYGDLKEAYEVQKKAYEERLNGHNREVDRWNEAGGAPEDIYSNLIAKQGELAKEQKELNNITYELNRLARQINTISVEGDTLVSDYNSIVEEYNRRFSEEKEFTQGDYQKDSIHVYQFSSNEELQIVLAHEFGHSLSLGHVEDPKAIMYHTMELQTLLDGVTEGDQKEFIEVCGDSSFTLWSIL